MGENREERGGSEDDRTKVDSASPCDDISPQDELHRLSSAEQIKSIINLFINAVNARTFDDTQLPWTRVASNYTAVLHDPKAPVNSVQDIIDEQKRHISMAPEYSLRLLDIEISCLNEETGNAVVFWNAETNGLYPDVSIYTTGIIEFRRIGQKWMASRFQGARGMNGSGPPIF